ncbi:MAG: hypothetical protein IPK53_20170 [bacterium]|nr:hypothetical protein [bacterium]
MRSILSSILVLVFAGSLSAQGLDTCYHTLDEVHAFIFDLENDFPQFVQVDSIGHSRGEMLNHQFPVLCGKDIGQRGDV